MQIASIREGLPFHQGRLGWFHCMGAPGSGELARQCAHWGRHGGTEKQEMPELAPPKRLKKKKRRSTKNDATRPVKTTASTLPYLWG
ncbi:MAG TPA: hypothetical protein VKT82_10150 [Ktedonobacterales bacterium]|nr:hypothetical protein [Ktedonobacterales bacterium]